MSAMHGTVAIGLDMWDGVFKSAAFTRVENLA